MINTDTFEKSELIANERQARSERVAREEAAHVARVEWAAKAAARGQTLEAYLGI